jgi:Family of unknown function (DUF6527)
MRRYAKKLERIRPEFVDAVPEDMEQGVLYISIPYRVAMHKCACGCGEEVVTPIAPDRWTFAWDGDSVTLRPSIGNFSLPCHSHYWIVENRVIWVRRWKPRR